MSPILRCMILAAFLPATSLAQGTFPAPSELDARPLVRTERKELTAPASAFIRLEVLDEPKPNEQASRQYEEFIAKKQRITESQERSRQILTDSRNLLNQYEKAQRNTDSRQYRELRDKIESLEKELEERSRILDSTETTVEALKKTNSGLVKYSRSTFRSSYFDLNGKHGEFTTRIKRYQERLKPYADSLKALEKTYSRRGSSTAEANRLKLSQETAKRARELLDSVQSRCALLGTKVIEKLLDGIGDRDAHLSPNLLSLLLSQADSLTKDIGSGFTKLDAAFTFLDDERRSTQAFDVSRDVEALDAQPSLLFASAIVTPTINLLGRFDNRDKGQRVYGYLFKGPEGIDSTDASYNLTRLFLPAASTFGFTVGYSKMLALFHAEQDRSKDPKRYDLGLGMEANLVWKRFPDFTASLQTTTGTNGNARKITSAPLTNIAFLHLKPTLIVDVVKDLLSVSGMANMIFPLDKVASYQAAFQRFNQEFAEKSFVLFNVGARAYFPLNEMKDKLLSFDFNFMFHNAQTRHLLVGNEGTLADTGIPIIQVGYKSAIAKK